MKCEELQPYKSGDKFGLEDEKGKIIINPIFDKIHRNNDFIVATLPDGRFFYFYKALDDMAYIEYDDCENKYITWDRENKYKNTSEQLFMTMDGEIITTSQRWDSKAVDDSFAKFYKNIEQNKIEDEKRNLCTSDRMHPNEYKRTCGLCGTIWYSSKNREAYLENKKRGSFAHDFFHFLAGGTNDGIEIVIQQADFELTQMRTCPNCKSVNCITED